MFQFHQHNEGQRFEVEAVQCHNGLLPNGVLGVVKKLDDTRKHGGDGLLIDEPADGVKIGANDEVVIGGEVFLDCVDDEDDEVVVVAEEEREGEVVGALQEEGVVILSDQVFLHKSLLDERLNDIVGSAYYVAPEVLHRSYGTEVDVWSIEAKDFVKRILNKDPQNRISAAQALSHPWIQNCNNALSKTLTADELYYLREQFALLEPRKNGSISLENVNKALMKYATDAMKESHILDFLSLELGLGPSIPVHVVLHDWIRHTDGKLSFLGFVKFKAKALWIC
ncbi:hypothetical protein JHK87_033901 [Glycine soja]|nr:hypothetical protein JHK87_033901 [Glycine soja]